VRVFSNLYQATRFLTSVLNHDDRDRLASACRRPPPREWELTRLREVNAETPLVRLYAGRWFPADADTFKLGGHAAELGHIHIDFVRTRAGWVIDRIWMCR
jgi:hypothetical protein